MEANEVESGARDCDHWNCGEAFPGESSLFFAGPSRAFLGASFAKLRRFTGSSVSAHKAIIYLRQFSRQQVKHNKQSQRLQYAGLSTAFSKNGHEDYLFIYSNLGRGWGWSQVTCRRLPDSRPSLRPIFPGSMVLCPHDFMGQKHAHLRLNVYF